MERRITERYGNAILREAMARYGIADDQIRPLEATENFVYQFERAGRSHILRVGHSLRRSEALVRGELDWVNHLTAAGVSVAPAVRSETGNLVEAVDDGADGRFLVTAFVKARGRSPHDRWTPALYASFGELMGGMHAAAERYQPPRPDWKRPEWDDEIMDLVARHLPGSERVAKQKYQDGSAHLRTLSRDGRCYGLVHFDAHGGNLVADDAGRLTIFDFDECCYSWYANDIAVALFALAIDAPDPPAFAPEFLSHFLQGYRRAYDLERDWLREMPVFLKMVEIFLYAVIHRDFGLRDGNDVGKITDAWCARFMAGRRHKIEQDVPCIDFDFGSLAADG